MTFERSSRFDELPSIQCSVQWVYFENGSIVPSGRKPKGEHHVGNQRQSRRNNRRKQRNWRGDLRTHRVKWREDVSNLIGLAIERYGKLDVLVNNAGVAPISLLDELRVEDWEEMIDVNLKGVLYGIAAALPVFRRQSFGHLVNVISTAGIQIIPTMATGTANTRDTFFKSWANTNPLSTASQGFDASSTSSESVASCSAFCK